VALADEQPQHATSRDCAELTVVTDEQLGTRPPDLIGELREIDVPDIAAPDRAPAVAQLDTAQRQRLHGGRQAQANPRQRLHIMGSGALIQQLSSTRLIHEYMLSIHLLVLGAGHRLFDEGFAPTRFDLVKATPTTPASSSPPIDRTPSPEPRPTRAAERVAAGVARWTGHDAAPCLVQEWSSQAEWRD
jgi:hypothetical protein